MEMLLSMVRTVAPTDATVLITGESGTGKELVSRTVHELSVRREKPLVVVDCSAITASLIESELFGHEKGAFTGAQQSRVGRLVEADGGTVLLDEIGELPLEVQSKFLRFVQEKQLIAVGGTRRRRVDVRIIAATNRDLAAEVAAGRFREDLYHRLNVVTLSIPPLRQRREDILHLARYFLESFSLQYQKDVRLSPDVEALLVRYAWPGNVRELRNRLMQAVIFNQGGVIGPEHLRLPESGDSTTGAESATVLNDQDRADRSTTRALDEPPPQEGSAPRSPWHELRSALARQVERASNGGLELALPLGKWLSEDLVLEAHAAAGGVGRRGAALLGIPSTTYQRRWRKAHANRKSGLAQRAPEWGEVRRALEKLVHDPEISETDLLDRTENVLLVEIQDRFPGDARTGSALLGTTPTTFRRRLEQLREISGQETTFFASEPVFRSEPSPESDHGEDNPQ
jgi:transcriptional regulator with GAF, ATPase, and Fis domain